MTWAADGQVAGLASVVARPSEAGEVGDVLRVAGEAGTAKAKARAGFGHAGDPSQFDCLDKTTNTIGLLAIVAQMGLLRHHTLDVPESRGGLGGLPHTTAVVRERDTAQKWAVDGWTHNNGEYPDIMRLERWRSES